jgi:hypothetical protein
MDNWILVGKTLPAYKDGDIYVIELIAERNMFFSSWEYDIYFVPTIWQIALPLNEL